MRSRSRPQDWDGLENDLIVKNVILWLYAKLRDSQYCVLQTCRKAGRIFLGGEMGGDGKIPTILLLRLGFVPRDLF